MNHQPLIEHNIHQTYTLCIELLRKVLPLPILGFQCMRKLNNKHNDTKKSNVKYNDNI